MRSILTSILVYILPIYKTPDSPKLQCELVHQRPPYPGIIYISTTGKNSKAGIQILSSEWL